jgi:hypothetical protein
MAWFVLGGGGGLGRQLDALEARLAAARPPVQHAATNAADPATRMAGTPLFSLTTGPGAVTEPVIRLEGLAVSPRRRAALISVDGKPSDWLDLGATRDGVTLVDIQATKVTVDTATSFKVVGLWDTSAGAGPSATASSSAVPPGGSIPSGAHASSAPPSITHGG